MHRTDAWARLQPRVPRPAAMPQSQRPARVWPQRRPLPHSRRKGSRSNTPPQVTVAAPRLMHVSNGVGYLLRVLAILLWSPYLRLPIRLALRLQGLAVLGRAALPPPPPPSVAHALLAAAPKPSPWPRPPWRRAWLARSPLAEPRWSARRPPPRSAYPITKAKSKRTTTEGPNVRGALVPCNPERASSTASGVGGAAAPPHAGTSVAPRPLDVRASARTAVSEGDVGSR